MIPKNYLNVFAVILIMGLAACGGGSKKITPVETIVVTSGSPQSTTVSTAFGAPLVATVSTDGTPNAGVSVVFAAPGAGASSSFGSGATTATVTTCLLYTSPSPRDCS